MTLRGRAGPPAPGLTPGTVIDNEYAPGVPPFPVQLDGDEVAVDVFSDTPLQIGDHVLCATVHGKTYVVSSEHAQPTQQPWGWIQASKSGTTVLASGVWQELSFDTLSEGGAPDTDQLTLSGGKLLVPANGYWRIVMTCHTFGTTSRVLMDVDNAGNGSAGASTLNRWDIAATSAILFGLEAQTGTIPRFRGQNDLMTGYVYSLSAQTVGASAFTIVGERVA